MTLPTFFDPSRLSFSAEARRRVRSQLGLKDEIVLAYSGSVSMPWQRFDCVCELTARLAENQYPVRLLALVHPDGHSQARQILEPSGAKALTHLLAVAPREMAAYLSAADIGLFLRHTHLMNRVVTSAKLGEYLAAGLPLLTTWACPFYRPFADRHAAAIQLPDSLELPADFAGLFASLATKGRDDRWRSGFSQAAIAEFSEENNLSRSYVQFIRNLLH